MVMSVSNPGVLLSGNDELAQSLGLYFRTPKGSIPLHPELGFAIFDYVDRNAATVLQLIRDVRQGIALWDSRITVLRALPIFSEGKLKMKIAWKPTTNTTNIIQSLIVI